MKFQTFHEAYIYSVDKVYHNPQFFNAPRGNTSREILNYSYEIANPRERVCYWSSRKTNIVFNFAEVLWYLSGSCELDFIAYYASNMKKYSKDGQTLEGTAYGRRIFHYGNHDLNQWNKIIQILKQDQDSKRAFIQIFNGEKAATLDNIDVACTLGLQFFIRENHLYLNGIMRANDMYRGMVSDVFSFTFLQELLAKQLGLQMGSYFHMVSTAHIYEPDYERVESLFQKESFTKKYEFHFPEMPEGDNWSAIHCVLEYEKSLRTHKKRLTRQEVAALELDEYWKQVIILFGLYQSIYFKEKIDWDLFDMLYPVYQYFMKNKWSDIFSYLEKENN